MHAIIFGWEAIGQFQSVVPRPLCSGLVSAIQEYNICAYGSEVIVKRHLDCLLIISVVVTAQQAWQQSCSFFITNDKWFYVSFYITFLWHFTNVLIYIERWPLRIVIISELLTHTLSIWVSTAYHGCGLSCLASCRDYHSLFLCRYWYQQVELSMTVSVLGSMLLCISNLVFL